MSGVIVSLCDRSGNALRPWWKARYECWAVDVEAGWTVEGVERFVCDVRTWVPPVGRVEGVMCWPPCTAFASVGAGWWERKGVAALLEGLSVVDACVRLCERLRPRWWFLENPHGRLSRYLGQPGYVFQPWEYGDPWSKQTCIWSGGEFRMPVGSGSEVDRPLTDQVGDAERRSVTAPGFSQAVFESNCDVPAKRGGRSTRDARAMRGDQANRDELGFRDVLMEVERSEDCANCGRRLTCGGRRDRVTCGDRCRSALSRRRRRCEQNC